MINEWAEVFVNEGDIVISDDGERLEVTCGNAKWRESECHESVASWNSHFIRVRRICEASTIFELLDGQPDFLWYANRIEKVTA